ncbi:hypothetical protein [Sphingobacterium hungaricum]|uniref:Uncharacterized protein n=1 Tax=Sphingobacterium hungaricum TaxID=2082723 RepID=A0A928UTY1_9SPHI|nr:hypothetical protein [Sphingobacterium hungaricum]MBE8712823.1 hypothetical protein [Sphingobacterium hungaricum]
MSFTKIIFTSIFVFGIGIFQITNNSKTKSEYEKSNGSIEYLGKEFENLPNRHKGDYRYLKITTYPYLFEIYEPNSEPTEKKIDDLKLGDVIEIYYYEVPKTKTEGINRFAQFIDMEGKPYFIRNAFQKQLGYVLIGLCVLLNVFGFILFKIGKINW